jgi:hypothetical protein
MTAGTRRRSRHSRSVDTSTPDTTSEDTLPAYTITSDEALDAIWAQHLAADRFARQAGEVAAGFERDADRFHVEAEALRDRAEQIINEARQKQDAEEDLRRRAGDARRDEARHSGIAHQLEALVDAETAGNGAVTHPRSRQGWPALVVDPLTAALSDVERDTSPRLAADLPGALAAVGTRETPAASPSDDRSS